MVEYLDASLGAMLGLEEKSRGSFLGGEYEWDEADDGSDKAGGVPMESRLAEQNEERPAAPSEGRPSADWRRESRREASEGWGLAPPGLLDRPLRRSLRYAAAGG